MSFLTDLSRAKDILAHQLRFNLLLSNDDAAILFTFSERFDFAVTFYATSTTPPSGPRPPRPILRPWPPLASPRRSRKLPPWRVLERHLGELHN